MWRVMASVFAFSIAASALNAQGAEDQSKAAEEARKDGCKVVERKSSDSNNSGSMTSSVTAGGGKVSGYTTGGNSVTVHSGDGRTSSSVATAGSSGGSTVVAGSGSGDCTIYVDPGKDKK